MVACSGASTVLIAFVTLILSRLGHASAGELLQNFKLTTDEVCRCSRLPCSTDVATYVTKPVMPIVISH